MKHAAQLAQEAKRVVEKLLWDNMDDHQQLPRSQLLRLVGTVQSIPTTLRIVASLITVAVSVVVFAVLVIQGVALSLQVLTVKAIIKTSSVVAL